ncbi:poly(3-hydroxybutyrate) depolymerase [Geodermatophilus bullaregiensis]|uniref:polyhydroxyalkanoate depolymerase n=1 Tax=Geodermatophilus bullaregiensis TaxID=1564160 RepID=UPI0019591C0B|nr:polyhydroxyalkanoate depolymerase [Geodermatophilus bullaregiensis]MBM7804361.1 poly(3-hydroxybutyrate) depolymerase [Geodermatophilus bullaregiensis]
MLYTAYEWQQRLTAPARTTSALTARAIEALPAPLAGLPAPRRLRAACRIVADARPTHVRPEWGIDAVEVDGRSAEVVVGSALSTPFADVLHFAKPDVGEQPRVLVVGPISGHFATLLRPTVRTLLADHDVYVVDWRNARDVPVSAGRFGLDEYVDHVLQALRHLGGDTHVMAVCQPAPLVLAAVAVLAAADDPAQPRSVTLMAGPIDTRVNPNRVNLTADRHSLSRYERLLTTTVPARHAGAGRRVYPGVTQLTAFMSMNPRRHLGAHLGMYRAMVAGDEERAAATRSFYEEYGAVMDVPAEFYLETLQRIFMEHDLPRGVFTWRGQPVDPSVITRTALLTVEGAHDDMCSPGQTEAAHALCTGIPAERRRHHLQDGVGHYGVFAGSRWEQEIYPVFRAFVAEQEDACTAAATAL